MVCLLYGSRYPGFKVLKMRAKGGMPVAFADFEVYHTVTADQVQIIFKN